MIEYPDYINCIKCEFEKHYEAHIIGPFEKNPFEDKSLEKLKINLNMYKPIYKKTKGYNLLANIINKKCIEIYCNICNQNIPDVDYLQHIEIDHDMVQSDAQAYFLKILYDIYQEDFINYIPTSAPKLHKQLVNVTDLQDEFL